MKSLIRKIGIALVLLAILKIGVAQVVDFGYDNPCAEDFTHFVSTTTGSSSITSYKWYLGSGTSTVIGNDEELSYKFINPDVYLVTLEAFIGNTSVGSKSKNIAIYDPPTANFSFMDNCLGIRAEFAFIPVVDENDDNDVEIYQWDFGDGEGEYNNIMDPFHAYDEDGSYNVTLIVTSQHGCKDTLTSQIQVYTPPLAIIRGTLEEICVGEMLEIYVDDYPNVIWGASVPPELYNPQGDTLTFDVPSGISQIEAEVVIFQIFGGQTICKDTAVTKIMVNPIPEISISSTEEMVLPGGLTELSASSESTIVEYFWNPIHNMDNPNSDNPSVTVYKPTTYYVSVIDENGCKNSGSIFVDVDLKADNLFTPNNDGHNDTWFAANGGLSDDFELVVFNRWGEEVLNQKGYQNDWDGTSNGDELPEGAYYYVIKHDSFTYTGSITLLR
ncbi:MAG: gliding motility-associated C-terminal domain-containing protein [Bacteroidota bacterium]|nr:gliding motility-associated C-terminal domain-containing protein [Bacteroidota bacterium]